MNLHILQYIRNHCPPPMIYFKTKPLIGKKPDKNFDSLRVEIKIQPGKIDSKVVSIYVPFLNTGSSGSLLKFLVLVNNIIKSQNVTTVSQRYDRTKNIFLGEPMKVF